MPVKVITADILWNLVTSQPPSPNIYELMPLDPSELDLFASCKQSTAVFSKTFMPGRFSRPFDPCHLGMFELVDKRPGDVGYRPQKLAAGFRGCGKSSIIGYSVPAKRILFQEVNFIMYIASSHDNAIEKTEALRDWLVGDPIVRYYFGSVKAGTWGKEDSEVQIGSHRIRIKPKGADQKLRGALFGDWRPDLVLVDDVEDPDDLDSAEVRVKKKRRFYADVKNLIDRGAELGSWEMIFLGNILHHDSLIVELLQSRFWDKQTYPLCTDEFETLNPNFMSSADCRELYEEYKEACQVDVFFREFLCDPTVRGEDAPFSQKYFKTYDEIPHKARNWTVAVIDPSRTAKPSSAPTGIVCWTVDAVDNKIYVRDVRQGHWEPEEQYDQLVDIIRSNNVDLLGIEVTGLHEFITHPIKTFLHERGVRVEILELHARMGVQEKGKIERVKQLIPWYRQGHVYHNPACCGPLEDQLLAFPFMKNWSLADPFGYINEILEHGEIYLSAGYDEYAYDPKVIEAEYAELEKEDEWEPLDDFRFMKEALL